MLMDALSSNIVNSPGKWTRFLEHLHPRKVDLNSLAYSNTWGLGGISLVLFMLLIVSGALMLLAYKPSPQSAYTSVQHLETAYLFGPMVRSIHFFSANGLVITLFCHMLRVVFTCAYTGPRISNWWVGLGLGFGVAMSCFTGYLLPWDQTAYWAITICIHMFEYLPWGDVMILLPADQQGEVSAKTLQLFYTIHTTFLPVGMVILLTLHFWKIRKAKGLVFALSENGKHDKVSAWPNLFLREAVTALIVIALVLITSAMVSIPLGEMVNEGLSPNPAKAPWYFAGFQELLINFHPFMAVCLIPAAGFTALIFLPFPAGNGNGSGTWFISQKARKAALISLAGSILAFPALIGFNTYLGPSVGEAQTLAFSGLTIAGVVLISGAGAFMLTRQMGLHRNETVQTLFIFYMAGFLIFTMTCIWLRGKGMALLWETLP